MPARLWPNIPSKMWYLGATSALTVWAANTILPWYVTGMVALGLAVAAHRRNPDWLQVVTQRIQAAWNIEKVRSGAVGTMLVAAAMLIAYFSQRDWPDAIPAVRAAEAKMHSIEVARETVQNSLINLTDGIEQARTTANSAGAISLRDVVRQARSLLVLADDMPARLAELKALQTEYRLRMDGADEVFTKAAGVWRGFAAEETTVAGTEGIQAAYISCAKLWEAYAHAIQINRQRPLDFSELELALRYIDRGRQFLSRLIAHIEDFPPVDALDKQRTLEENIRQFIRNFDELRESIDTLTDQVKETSEHSNIAAKLQRLPSAEQLANGLGEQDRSPSDDSSQNLLDEPESNQLPKPLSQDASADQSPADNLLDEVDEADADALSNPQPKRSVFDRADRFDDRSVVQASALNGNRRLLGGDDRRVVQGVPDDLLSPGIGDRRELEDDRQTVRNSVNDGAQHANEYVQERALTASQSMGHSSSGYRAYREDVLPSPRSDYRYQPGSLPYERDVPSAVEVRSHSSIQQIEDELQRPVRFAYYPVDSYGNRPTSAVVSYQDVPTLPPISHRRVVRASGGLPWTNDDGWRPAAQVRQYGPPTSVYRHGPTWNGDSGWRRLRE